MYVKSESIAMKGSAAILHNNLTILNNSKEKTTEYGFAGKNLFFMVKKTLNPRVPSRSCFRRKRLYINDFFIENLNTFKFSSIIEFRMIENLGNR